MSLGMRCVIPQLQHWFLSVMAEPEPTPWGSGLLTAEQGFIWRHTNVPMTSGVVPECVCAAKGEASADPLLPLQSASSALSLRTRVGNARQISQPKALLLLCMQSAGA